MYTELNNYEIYSNTPIFTINEDGDIVPLPITNVCDTNLIRIFDRDKSLTKASYQDVRLNKEITCIPMISAVLFSSYDLVSKYSNVYLNNPEGFLDAYMEDHETGTHSMILLDDSDIENVDKCTPGIYCVKSFDEKMYEYVREGFEDIRYGNNLASTKIKSVDDDYPELMHIIQKYCTKMAPEILSDKIDYSKTRVVFEIGNRVTIDGKPFLEISHEFLSSDIFANKGRKCIFYSSINKFYMSTSKDNVIQCRAAYLGSGKHHNNIFEEFNNFHRQVNKRIAQSEARKETIMNVVSILWDHREFAMDLVKGGINLFKNTKKSNGSTTFADEVGKTVTKMLNDEGIDCKQIKKKKK